MWKNRNYCSKVIWFFTQISIQKSFKTTFWWIQSDIIWHIIPKLNRGRQKRILIIKSPTVKIDCVVWSPGVMSSRLSVFRRVKFKLKRSHLQTIYISFIRPLMEYGDIVWDSSVSGPNRPITEIVIISVLSELNFINHFWDHCWILSISLLSCSAASYSLSTTKNKQSAVTNYGSYTFSSCFTFVRVFIVLFARASRSRFHVMISVLIMCFRVHLTFWSMSHRRAVTFDTVCLILFVSCVLSFRLSLRLLYVFLLFLFSTSRHNTTNFISLKQQQQQQQPPPLPPRPDVFRAQSKRQLDRTDVSHTCSFNK
jgi:hypothetical protein